ncbi:hypothetical protein [Streptomyces sp. RFCAC02]|uniref:hypothetical protein n=1 Tax=Streptomyces sp. RFCAC02 TaxID=2499143 RepID=UPI00101F79D5|nr:hypothetical protein [Streptomyces sp. RFCAC02]
MDEETSDEGTAVSGGTAPDTPGAVDPSPFALHVEALRARMPPAQFIVLMRAFHTWHGCRTGQPPALALPAPRDGETALSAPEVRAALLTLMTLADEAS